MSAEGVTWSNPNVVEQHEEEQVEQRDERQREAAIEQAEHKSVRERLMEGRERELTVEIEITGVPVEFRTLGINVQKQSIELANELEDVATEDLDEQDLESMDGIDMELAEAGLTAVDFIAGVLSEHSLDDDLDEEFWGDYDNAVLEEVLTNLTLASKKTETPEDVVSFREK